MAAYTVQWRHFSKSLGVSAPFPVPSFYSAPLLSSPSISSFPFPPFPPLRSRTPEIQLGAWGAGSGAEPQPKSNLVHIRLNITSSGNNFNDFPENELTKYRAVYTIKANRGPKFCRYSFTQDSNSSVFSRILNLGCQ